MPDLQRRTLRVLVGAQTLAGAGLAAGITVGALLAQDMLGSTGSSGLPIALLTIGSAAAASGVGRLSQRSGRRAGLAAGYGIGAVGAFLVVLAAAIDNVPLLFAALLLYGAGAATNLQARYAGADLAHPSHRARAVSVVLVATTLGAVAGPNLADLMGDVAASIGVRPLAGPFLLGGFAYGLGALVVLALLRPDPLLTARELAAAPPDVATSSAAATPGAAATPATAAGPGDAETGDPVALRLGAAGMILTTMVMVALMTMTPVHMGEHGHGLAAAGAVISVHVAAMYLPAPLSGWLVDRHGPRTVLAGAGTTLLAAGLVAALAPDDSVAILAISLALLGFGWSLGLVAGSALVTASVPLADRARTQGTVDVLVALVGAAGGLGSGFVVAATSYAALGLFGGALALLLVPVALRSGRVVPRPA